PRLRTRGHTGLPRPHRRHRPAPERGRRLSADLDSAARPRVAEAAHAPATPAVLPATLRGALTGLLGEDAVITAPGSLLVYESDALAAYRARPRAVLLPRDTADVAGAVKLLADAGIPFLARGAGTGLSAGALALHDAVIISTARMQRILEL